MMATQQIEITEFLLLKSVFLYRVGVRRGELCDLTAKIERSLLSVNLPHHPHPSLNAGLSIDAPSLYLVLLIDVHIQNTHTYAGVSDALAV